MNIVCIQYVSYVCYIFLIYDIYILLSPIPIRKIYEKLEHVITNGENKIYTN